MSVGTEMLMGGAALIFFTAVKDVRLGDEDYASIWGNRTLEQLLRDVAPAWTGILCLIVGAALIGGGR